MFPSPPACRNPNNYLRADVGGGSYLGPVAAKPDGIAARFFLRRRIEVKKLEFFFRGFLILGQVYSYESFLRFLKGKEDKCQGVMVSLPV